MASTMELGAIGFVSLKVPSLVTIASSGDLVAGTFS